MTRLRTHNNRAKMKALSRRQIRERGNKRLYRLISKMFRHQRNAILKVGINFRDAPFAARDLGKAMNSLHLAQHYGSPTVRSIENNPEFIIPNSRSRVCREGHTPPPVSFLETDLSKAEERILNTLEKKQLYAETYGMGDIKVAMLTGTYPNIPIRKK